MKNRKFKNKCLAVIGCTPPSSIITLGIAIVAVGVVFALLSAAKYCGDGVVIPKIALPPLIFAPLWVAALFIAASGAAIAFYSYYSCARLPGIAIIASALVGCIWFTLCYASQSYLAAFIDAVIASGIAFTAYLKLKRPEKSAAVAALIFAVWMTYISLLSLAYLFSAR